MESFEGVVEDKYPVVKLISERERGKRGRGWRGRGWRGRERGGGGERGERASEFSTILVWKIHVCVHMRVAV